MFNTSCSSVLFSNADKDTDLSWLIEMRLELLPLLLPDMFDSDVLTVAVESCCSDG